MSDLKLLGKDAFKRFIAKVDNLGGDGCWQWTACIGTHGYGDFWLGEQGNDTAHRVSYATFNGPVPDGLDVGHLCMNKSCVRPDHLQTMTRLENMSMKDGALGVPNYNSLKTHCKHGHLFTDENTYTTPKGSRNCRECARLAQSRYRNRMRA